MIEFHLPYPPSVNHYWRRVGARTLISRGGRAFRQAVCSLLAARGMRPLSGPLMELKLDPVFAADHLDELRQFCARVAWRISLIPFLPNTRPARSAGQATIHIRTPCEYRQRPAACGTHRPRGCPRWQWSQ